MEGNWRERKGEGEAPAKLICAIKIVGFLETTSYLK